MAARKHSSFHKVRRSHPVAMALMAAAGAGLGTPQLLEAASGTWTQISAGNASGTWSNAATGNWASNTVADGSGNTADFSTLDITAASTVSLGAPRTIGNLIFGDTDNTTVARWILDNGGSASNVLTLAGATPTITVNNLGAGSITNSTATISAVISGTNGLTKDGAGTVASQSTFGRGVLLLSGANNYSGGTIISSGALAAGNNSALGSGAVTVVNGAQLQVRGVTIANTININGSSALFSTASSGSNLSGIVNLQSNSSINLATNSGNATMTLSGTVNLNGFTLTANGANTTTISGVIDGSSGGVTKLNNGTLRISNDNSGTYAGTTALQLGTLEIGSDGALGSGTFAFSPNNDAAATIRSMDTTARSIGNAVTLGAVPLTANSNSRFIFGSTSVSLNGNLTFTNTTDISLGSTQRRFEVGSQTQFDAGFTGSGGITKQSTSGNGVGTLVINGDSTYTGPTNVNAGTLLVNGTHEVAGAPTVGAYSVASGATLGGTGSTDASVTVASGGLVAPGASIESLGVGSMDLAGTLLIEWQDTNGSQTGDGIDVLNVAGALDITGASVNFIDFTDPDSSVADNPAYIFATYASGQLTGTFASETGVPDGYEINYAYNGNSIALVPIPEPGTFGLFGAAMAGLFVSRRRRNA